MDNLEMKANAVPEEIAGLAEEIAEAVPKCRNKVVAGFGVGMIAGMLCMYTVPILVRKIKAHKEKPAVVEEYDPEVVKEFTVVEDEDP